MMERCRRCSMPRRGRDGPIFCHCCGADRPWKVYMNEQEWLTSTDIQAMLRVAEDHGVSPRKLRLFACALLRAVGTGTWAHDNLHALRIAEAFADGQITPDALAAERTAFRPALVGEWVLRRDPLEALHAILGNYHVHSPDAPALLRDLLGNPFRPVPLRPDPCPHCQGTGYVERTTWGPDDSGPCGECAETGFTSSWREVLSIAGTIHHERTYTDLPVLADALEDAGCDNDALLDHLRSPGPHARGCWALDLILGKE
jgi:hypothetical protein